MSVRLVLAAAAALAVVASSAADEAREKLYQARKGKCDLFVAPDGSDDNSGTSLRDPLETVQCALNPACASIESGDVICLLAGVFPLEESIMSKLQPETSVTLMALGEDGSSVLDGQDSVQILNLLQTSGTIRGIEFRRGAGASGSAVYGERQMQFSDCSFVNNHATIHAGAVMGGRTSSFNKCTFKGNSARFAGALRINDIGTGVIEDCEFIGNWAEGRGGAVVTQIETPDEQFVTIKHTTFCFNESPMGPHIYNYRDKTHDCTDCQFNSKACCSNHGKVLPSEDAPAGVPTEFDGHTRDRVCVCEAGWSGERCETKGSAPVHDEM